MSETDFSALVQRGHEARAAGDRPAALAFFRRAHGLIPDHRGVLLELAKELRDGGEVVAADTTYGALLAVDPADFGANVGKGLLARQRGDRQAALEYFQAANRTDPNHIGGLVELSTELLAANKKDEAASVFEKILALDPKSLHATIQLALLARQRDDRQFALSLFEQALEAHPNHHGLMLETAYDLIALSRLDEAEVLYNRCLQSGHSVAEALLGLALVERQRGNRTETLTHLRASIAANPNLLSSQMELAHELREAGRFDEAREQIDGMLAKDPGDYRALLLLGLLSRATGDMDQALTAFRRAAEATPDNPSVLVECAVEERIAGNGERSMELLTQALAIDPKNLSALMQSAEHALLGDNPPRALEFAEQAIDAYPATAQAYVQASRALVTLGRIPDALRLLRTGLKHCGDTVVIAAAQIEIFRRVGQWGAAQSVLAERQDSAQRFPLWQQSSKLALEIGDFAAVQSALENPPVETVYERAMALLLQGELAEAQWDFPTARERLTEALALLGRNGMLHEILARLCMVDMDIDGAETHLRQAVQLNTTAIRLRGYSSNITQSHLGQLLDDLRMDREMIAKLAALRDKPFEAQLAPLAALVSAEPDHTSAAIRLLMAARRSGVFAPVADRDNEALIPRQIVQFWNTPDPPDDVAAAMESWEVQNPGFSYHRFDDTAAHAFLQAHYDESTVTAFRRARQPAMRADIFRLAWLYVEGGVYTDADDACLAPIVKLLRGARLVTYQEEYGTLGNNFLAAAPAHPVIGDALHQAVTSINRGDSDTIWLQTGPGLLTRTFAQAMARTKLQLPLWLSSIVILERHELRRFTLPQIDLRYKRTDLHWMRQVSSKQAKREAASQQESAAQKSV